MTLAVKPSASIVEPVVVEPVVEGGEGGGGEGGGDGEPVVDPAPVPAVSTAEATVIIPPMPQLVGGSVAQVILVAPQSVSMHGREGGGGKGGKGGGGAGGEAGEHAPKPLQAEPYRVTNSTLPDHAQRMRSLFTSDKPFAACQVERRHRKRVACEAGRRDGVG